MMNWCLSKGRIKDLWCLFDDKSEEIFLNICFDCAKDFLSSSWIQKSESNYVEHDEFYRKIFVSYIISPFLIFLGLII